MSRAAAIAPPSPPEQPKLPARVLAQSLLDNIPDFVYFKDLQSRYLAVSKSVVRTFGGATVQQIIGRTDFDFFSERHARPAFDAEQQIVRTGEPILGQVERLLWPDHSVTWLRSDRLPLRDRAGKIVGTFTISRDITRTKEMELELETAHKALVDSSRIAGMAEVATGVLHNVGNVLNSLNVSASVVATGLRQSKAESLAKLAALLREQKADLANFLQNDPRGRRVPEFLQSLGRHAIEERQRLAQELLVLQKNVDHIKEIVSMQQAYATMIGVTEPLDPEAMMEDALHMNSDSLTRHEVKVEREFSAIQPVLAEKAKVLQILINLIRNAQIACNDSGLPEKRIVLRLEPGAGETLRFVVQDTGVGIPPENLTRIFQHGFTTRKEGHGFGLHSAANAAHEMKGTLTVQSPGRSLGATFTLELPSRRCRPPLSPYEFLDQARTLEADASLDETLLRAFLAVVPDYVYFKDCESRFIAASDSKVRRNKCTEASELYGKTDADFWHEEDALWAKVDEENIIATGEPIISKLEHAEWQDGRVTWTEVSKLPLRDETGEIAGTFGISKDVTESQRIEAELEKARRNLVDTSRKAGMAEVATGVLHNVGNVLTSLNVSASVISASIAQSKADSLARVAALVDSHRADLSSFIANDPKGSRIPDFLESLARHGLEERETLLKELASLQANIDHIKEIVSMQQAYATLAGVTESLDPAMLMDDALRMNAGALVRHQVALVREFHPVPKVVAEKAKVLQILVNFIRNAKYACDEGGRADKTVVLRLEHVEDSVRFSVVDNGVGIPAENMPRLFQHGFTTRAGGHGFGLHSAVVAAKEMKGKISAHSEGPGCGATFTLELPIERD